MGTQDDDDDDDDEGNLSRCRLSVDNKFEGEIDRDIKRYIIIGFMVLVCVILIFILWLYI